MTGDTATKLILTRHGHVEGIEPERFRGRIELPLTALGRDQARRTAAFIADHWSPARVYCSPLGRCRDTALDVADACRLEPPTVTPALNDLDYGDWQWRTHDDVRAADPDRYALWRAAPHLVRFPGGEALQDLVARAGDALRDVLARHRGQTTVLVAHDSVNRALLLQVLDQPLSAYWRLSQDPCGVTEIDLDEGQARIRRINETGHLGPKP